MDLEANKPVDEAQPSAPEPEEPKTNVPTAAMKPVATIDERCFEYVGQSVLGAHLASGADYKTSIVNLQKRNKNLVNRDWKVPISRQNEVLPSRVRVLTFTEGGVLPQPRISEDIKNSTDLRQNLEAPRAAGTRICRVYLLEGTSPDLVEQFGNHFDIDPAVFVRHQRTGLWEGRHKAGNTPGLASNQDANQSFMMEYCELLFFRDELDGPSFRNPSDNRHISVSKKPSKNSKADVDKVGILHRKASFWSKKHKHHDTAWDGKSSKLCRCRGNPGLKKIAILILDPPLPQVAQKIGPPKYEVLVGSQITAKVEQLYGELYQGGYLDFIKHSDLTESTKSVGPERISMMDDLCFYWKTHGSLIGVENDPSLATIFLQKIIASNYSILVEYLKSQLNELEFDIVRTEIHEGKNQALDVGHKWSVLQSWSHRFPEYGDMLHDILEIHKSTQQVAVRGDAWAECNMDFEAINKRFSELRRRTEKLGESFIGLANMAGIQESLDEAKNVKVLTFLGLFFLPLSLLATIFAMGTTYGPGGPKFKVYFSVALPISGGLVISAVVILYGWNIHLWRKFEAKVRTFLI